MPFELPAFIDPASMSPLTLVIVAALAFGFLIMGGDWLSDGLSTAALAMKTQPLFVGLVITAVLGIVPQVVFLTTLSVADMHEVSLGGLMGGCIFTLLIPISYAGLKQSIPYRDRWVQWDLPLLVTYLVVFTFLCLDGGITQSEGIALLILALTYLFFRYQFGVQNRYGMTSFGANFVFGATASTIWMKTLGGLALILASSIYLAFVFAYLVGSVQLPAFALGMVAMFPFCLPEISFALAALRRGHGEIILGQGIGSVTILLLVGGGILGLGQLPIAPHLVNFTHLSIIVLLLFLWSVLRTSSRLWQWQATVILILCVAVVAITWAQGYGLLTQLSL